MEETLNIEVLVSSLKGLLQEIYDSWDIPGGSIDDSGLQALPSRQQEPSEVECEHARAPGRAIETEDIFSRSNWEPDDTS